MAQQESCSAFITVLCVLLWLTTVHGQCKVGPASVGIQGRTGQKLNSYYDCKIMEHSLNASQLAWFTSWSTTIFLPTVYASILVIGLPANGLAIWILAVKIKKMPSTLFLLNLATADLFFLLVLPFKVFYHFIGNNWIFGEPMCRMSVAFFYVNMYCSILFLTCISVDRYFSLVHPFKARSAKGWRKSVYISIGIWVTVAAASIPFLLVQQTVTFINADITTCHDVTAVCHKNDWLLNYMVGLLILGFAIPFLVIIFCNGSILLTLTPKRRNHSRVIWLILLVLVTFLLCFTPSNILFFFYFLNNHLEYRNQLYKWHTVALAVGALNSCIDPFIYYFTSLDFRELVKATICCQRGMNRELSGRTSDQLLQKKNLLSSQ